MTKPFDSNETQLVRTKHSRLDEWEAYVSGAESLFDRALDHPVGQILLIVISAVVMTIVVGVMIRSYHP